MENWRPQLLFGAGIVFIARCDCRWPSVIPLKGGPLFELFHEWDGHRAKGYNVLQLATKPMEENLHQELQMSLLWKAKGLALGKVRLVEDLSLKLKWNCALAFLRCGKWTERKQNMTAFMSDGILYTLMQTLSFISLYPCMKPHTCGLLCN